jgi:hypothetical protein
MKRPLRPHRGNIAGLTAENTVRAAFLKGLKKRLLYRLSDSIGIKGESVL